MATRLNNRNLIFFGSPVPALDWQGRCWKFIPGKKPCFLPHSTDIDYKLIHTHTHTHTYALTSLPPSLASVALNPPARRAGLWPAPRTAAGPDGCLLELDYFPVAKCVYGLCAFAEVFFLFSHCTPQGA